MPESQPTKPNIAIIGAGPSGLTLANILHRFGTSTTVFEKDPNAEARKTESGCLDLSVDGGQAAIKKAGIFDEFKKHARYDAQAVKIMDRDGNVHASSDGMDIERPEIDRASLRQILLDSLPETSIKWGHNLKYVEDDGTLHFEKSTRQRLAIYSGVTVYESHYKDPDSTHPEISSLVGPGTLFAPGDETRVCMLVQRQGDRSIRLYAYIRHSVDWDAGMDWKDPVTAREVMSQWLEGWDPKLRHIATSFEEPMRVRKLYMLPVGIRWPHNPRISLVGDAAHVMTPFEGEGANAAMRDALMLANAIIHNQEDIPKAHPGL
ncbi:putative Salicylate hydroxylase [Fusarium sp. LHS14.1]|nr:putative Salicylate hydroxylase [Fusarium sp. LHS14.1]